MPHTINGITFGAPARVQKLSELPQLVPHVYKGSDSKPTKYGSYIATVVNDDTDEEYKVYLPKYVFDRALPGKRFVYSGLIKKTDGSGHSYHSVEWEM